MVVFPRYLASIKNEIKSPDILGSLFNSGGLSLNFSNPCFAIQFMRILGYADFLFTATGCFPH